MNRMHPFTCSTADISEKLKIIIIIIIVIRCIVYVLFCNLQPLYWWEYTPTLMNTNFTDYWMIFGSKIKTSKVVANCKK